MTEVIIGLLTFGLGAERLPLFIFGAIWFFGVGIMLGLGGQHAWRRRQAKWAAAAEAVGPADPTKKFCCHCRWAVWDDRSPYTDDEWKCSHESSMKSQGDYLARGKQSLGNMYSCAVARASFGGMGCRTEGRFWKKRGSLYVEDDGSLGDGQHRVAINQPEPS